MGVTELIGCFETLTTVFVSQSTCERPRTPVEWKPRSARTNSRGSLSAIEECGEPGSDEKRSRPRESHSDTILSGRRSPSKSLPSLSPSVSSSTSTASPVVTPLDLYDNFLAHEWTPDHLYHSPAPPQSYGEKDFDHSPLGMERLAWHTPTTQKSSPPRVDSLSIQIPTTPPDSAPPPYFLPSIRFSSSQPTVTISPISTIPDDDKHIPPPHRVFNLSSPSSRNNSCALFTYNSPNCSFTLSSSRRRPRPDDDQEEEDDDDYDFHHVKRMRCT